MTDRPTGSFRFKQQWLFIANTFVIFSHSCLSPHPTLNYYKENVQLL